MNDALKKFLRLNILVAVFSVFIFLATGFFIREFNEPYLEGLPYETYKVASSLTGFFHGHIFLLLVVVPLLTALMTFPASEHLSPRSIKILKIFNLIYLVGAVGTLALLIYKGCSMVTGWDAIHDTGLLDKSFFHANKAIRSSLYGIIHLLMATGLAGVFFILLRALLKKIKAL